MPVAVGVGVGVCWGQLLAGGVLPSFTISNGNGVTGTASIVYVGPNWSVNSTGAQGVPGGPWIVTTAQLASGLPILLAAPTITGTTTFTVTAGANDPLYLSPSLDLPEYSYGWYYNGTGFIASGRSSGDITVYAGIKIEFVATAVNFKGSAVSRTVAQAGNAFTETLINVTDQQLLFSTFYTAPTAYSIAMTFVTSGTAPNVPYLAGDTAYGNPIIFPNGTSGITQSYSSAAFQNTTMLSVSTKFTMLISASTTRRQLYLKSGSSAFVAVDDTSAAFTLTAMNYAGLFKTGFGSQYVGQVSRVFVSQTFIDFSIPSNRDSFVDASGNVVNPPVAHLLSPSYGLDMNGNLASWNAGTNPGTWGNATKSGSAFT